MPISILLPKTLKITSPGKITPRHWAEQGSIYKRLPEFYKKHYIEIRSTLPKPVHCKVDERKYIVDHESGHKKRVQNIPPVAIYPKQARLGIWGGEGIVFGYLKPKQSGYKRPTTLVTKLWRPRVLKLLFYSEILDKYYALNCTRRTLNLIEEAQGFDNYILKTHIVDLHSEFATQLKREMLLKLAKKDTDLYPNDAEKRELIYKRYKKFEIPLEQAEWFGLLPWEAVKKQKMIEEARNEELVKPWKERFAKELAEYLENMKLEGKEIPAKPLREDEKPLSLRKSIWKEWTKRT